MIKKSYHQSFRAVAAFAVAAVLSAAVSASAQTIDTNIFGGTGTPTTLSATSVAGSNFATGPFGPGFTGNLSFGLGALTTLSQSISNGTYLISETGLTGLTANFDASKTFADSSLAAGQFYRFTLTNTNVSALNLLSGFNIQVSTGSGANTTVIADTGTGVGLIGVTNVIGLFNSGGVATFTFQAPANLPATSINVTFSGGLTASALGSTFAFTGASINQVPEPGTYAAVGVGLFALATTMRLRRRQA